MKQMRCPCCGASIEADTNGRDRVFCTYCGCQISVYDDRGEYTINKNINVNKDIAVSKTIHHRYSDDVEIIKERNKEKESKRSIIVSIVCFIVAFGLLLTSYLIEEIEQKQAEREGKISAGYYEDWIDQDYQTVVAHLEAAGFTNIEVIDLDDYGLAFWNDGKVEMISVGGNTSFSSSDYFYPDTKVVITHH